MEPSEIDFTAGSSYYAVIRLMAEDGYTFKKGESKPHLDIDACDYAFGGGVTVTGADLVSAAFRSTLL